MQPSFFKNLGPINIKTIKKNIVCDTHNIDEDENFINLSSINNLKKNGLSFISDNRIHADEDVIDGTLICSNQRKNEIKSGYKRIIVENVYEAVAILSNLFYRPYSEIDIQNLEDPKIGKEVKIDTTSIIEKGSIIGNNVKIASGCFIGHSCVIGDNTTIDSNTVITNSIISENVSIGRNVSIGQHGFGFSMNKKKNIKFFHIGRVILQSGANIGSNCTLDRGSFGDTVIGENTFLDNLCHIAHNVQIGTNCVFAAMSGVAGSTIIGNNVMAGGQSGIAGHLIIGDNVKIAAQSGVLRNIDNNSTVMGHPAINKFKYIKYIKKNYG